MHAPALSAIAKRIRIVLTSITISTLVLVSPAYARSSVLADPTGDVPVSAPAYADITGAKITEQIGTGLLYFKLELAGPVPETPAGGFVAWNWFVDRPGGIAFEYVVVVRYCSQQVNRNCGPGASHWESALTDNTNHGTQTLDIFQFRIDGATVKAFVDPALLGDPSRFDWFTVSRLAAAVGGTPPVDFAPDAGLLTFER